MKRGGEKVVVEGCIEPEADVEKLKQELEAMLEAVQGSSHKKAGSGETDMVTLTQACFTHTVSSTLRSISDIMLKVEFLYYIGHLAHAEPSRKHVVMHSKHYVLKYSLFEATYCSDLLFEKKNLFIKYGRIQMI